METLEKKLKILLKERKAIDEKIEKISNKILLTRIIVVWPDLTNKRELLKTLRKVLDENQHTWFNLILLSPGPFKKSVSIFGRRNKIASNLRKIVNKIVYAEAWRMRDIYVGFNLLMQKLEYMV